MHPTGSVDIAAVLRSLINSPGQLPRLLAIEPTREDAHRGLMKVFAFRGSRERAARQYRMCVDALERELGVGPSDETNELLSEIETGALGGPVAQEDGGGTLVGLMPWIVGRDRELLTVAGLLDLLDYGGGAALLVEGPAGIGKTRLLHEVLQRARARGDRVAYGSARANEGRFPYAPLTDAQRNELSSRGAAVVLAAPGSELDGWLRKGRTRAAIVRPDRAVMQAGRNIQAICDAMPTFTGVHGGAVEVES